MNDECNSVYVQDGYLVIQTTNGDALTLSRQDVRLIQQFIWQSKNHPNWAALDRASSRQNQPWPTEL
ncbi:hypothetical protein Lepto7375DRAFT_7250 [Leptolyngbya sp. PCC 7375]|nr:hypothetical protein Lepto7375DRAFT_7250 [Leptolyngbya sp. PCC 7375]